MHRPSTESGNQDYVRARSEKSEKGRVVDIKGFTPKRRTICAYERKV